MLTRRSQSASTPETGSCERLQRRNSSCDCRFAYDNVLADVGPAAAPTETDVQIIEMTTAEAAKPGDDVEERCSYEIAAAQASCWLRQIICNAADSTASQTDEEPEDADLEENQQDEEAQAQLDSLYSQFDCLCASSQSRVPQHLQPAQLRRLRARQLAVSACFAEARSLDRQRRVQVSNEKSEVFERLQSCRERLQLVAKCASRLGRGQPARQQSNSSRIRQVSSDEDLNDEIDGEDGSTIIDRDRRLVRDSAARARRNVDDFAMATAKAVATFRRLGRRLLVDCVDCLRCRADRLGQRGREESASEDDVAETEFEEADGERLLARVESHLDEAAVGIGRLISLQYRRLKQNLDEIELAQLLLNFAKDLCSDECGNAHLNASDSDDNDVKSMTSSSSADSRGNLRETASDWLYRKERLEQLDCRLSVTRKSLNQLIFLTRARLTIRRDLQLRSVRLRHLRELAEAGGDRRFDPTDFLSHDETEAIRPTTRELLATRSAKLEHLAKQIRAEFGDTADAAKLAQKRLLDAEEALDRRRLEATDSAMKALRS